MTRAEQILNELIAVGVVDRIVTKGGEAVVPSEKYKLRLQDVMIHEKEFKLDGAKDHAEYLHRATTAAVISFAGEIGMRMEQVHEYVNMAEFVFLGGKTAEESWQEWLDERSQKK